MLLEAAKRVFPGWTAAATLVKDNGTDAVGFATDAIHAGDWGERLDAVVRTTTSLDHALDNAAKLPVDRLVKDFGLYKLGFDAAKLAVTQIVASGIVPGAKERVGRGSLLAAQDAFRSGIVVNATDTSRFGVRLAGGWMEAVLEDAATGAAMLRPGTTTGRELLAELSRARASVAKAAPVDGALVAAIDALFAKATGELDQRIAEATATAGHQRQAISGAPNVDALLRQAAASAELIVRDAPTPNDLAAAAKRASAA